MAEMVERKSPATGALSYERDSDAEQTSDADAEREGQEEGDETAQEEAIERLRREKEARAQALTLEIVGDLPYAEVKPPENVLFVCKLNPVTEDEDLDLIFSRFGKIVSCEVIRDRRTGDSLQYAFIEFENQKDCEQAYFKMQGVLIDDHRIHVDFSQSVSRLSQTWRDATNSKRAKQGGGFGGVAGLEKKRQYRAESDVHGQRSSGYDMILDKDGMRNSRDRPSERHSIRRYHSRSRSPRRRNYDYKNFSSPRDNDRRRDHSVEHRRESKRSHHKWK
ncbi:MAG: hypothetical protein Q9190_006303 [Brigantiaea leucoxantha]